MRKCNSTRSSKRRKEENTTSKFEVERYSSRDRVRLMSRSRLKYRKEWSSSTYAFIPGCSSVELLDPAHLMANITTPIPGLKGPFGVVVRMAERQEPNYLTLEVNHSGKGGSVSASSQISLKDEADGSLLTYDASANLEGPVAIANNPIGQGITRNTLKTFFERLEKTIA